MNAPDLLEFHAVNESWFYLGPLEAGKRAAARYAPPITEGWKSSPPPYLPPTRRYFVESDMSWGVGDTPEVAWRYFLGSEFGPDDEGLDAAVLRKEISQEI